MSFAEGFASGFSQSFGRAHQANLQKENQAFTTMLNQFNKNKELRQRTEAEDKKLVTQAKEITALTGAPEGAWTHAYNLLKSGMPLGTVSQLMEKSQFQPSEMEAGQVNTEEPQTLDIEQGEQPQAIEAPENTQLENNSNGIRGFISRMRQNKDERIQNRALADVARELGLSEEEVQDTLSWESGSFENPEVAQVSSQNQFTRTYKNPNVMDIESVQQAPVGSDQWLEAEKRLQAGRKEVESIVRPVQTSVTTFKSFVRNVDDMKTIVENNGDAVLNSPTTWAAKLFSELSATARSFSDLLGGESSTSEDKRDAQIMEELKGLQTEEARRTQGVAIAQRRISELESAASKLEDTSQAANLFDMKVKLLAYQLGMMYMQEGRSFSETERAMMQEIAGGGTTADKFFQNISNLVNSEMNRTQDVVDSTNKSLEGHYQSLGIFSKMTGLAAPQPINTEEEWAEIQPILDELAPYNNLDIGAGVREEVEMENSPYPGHTKVGVSKRGYPLYRNNQTGQIFEEIPEGVE